MSPSYNFSVAENRAAGTPVGVVEASAGNALYNVSYALRTHADLFAVDADGAIVTRAELDREELTWLVVEVQAVDTRIPPTMAVAVVRPPLDPSWRPLDPLPVSTSCLAGHGDGGGRERAAAVPPRALQRLRAQHRPLQDARHHPQGKRSPPRGQRSRLLGC